jgi:rhamnose utilization protein RhaD (predicted bifunctional aldolase and dehydrogenase)
MLDLTPLRRLSAKIGQNLDLVQAGGGNTSIKDAGTLWVKASGKWLARAMDEEMFLPVPLSDILGSMDGDSEYTDEYTIASGARLRPSVETSMHAVLPHRVVLHVHSVRTIAWAIRTDVPDALHDRLNGLRWEWIPYVHPGVVLGREIRNRLGTNPDILILGNHGLIVAADDFDSAEALLDDVERRLDLPVRPAPPADLEGLSLPGFSIAPDDEVHALATDPISLEIAKLGTFYPDQCVYLGPALARARIVPGKGVLVENDLNRAGREVLISVKRVIERATQPVRVLPDSEVSRLLNWDAEKYRIALANQYEIIP